MADLTNYITPDGRRLQLPPVFAAQFGGLTPEPPPTAVLPAPGAIPPAPPGQAAPALPDLGVAVPTDTSAALAAATPPPPQAPAPEPSPRPAPSTPAPAAQPSAAAPAQPSPAAGPVPARPMTERDLGKLGYSGVYNAQSSAIEEQKAAARKLGQAQADQMTVIGNAQAAAADEEKRILEQRQQIAEKNARDLELKTNEYLTNAKALADQKIDRTIDHPVLTAIGLALSTIGSAMKGQDNSAAIKGVYDALDRKVAAQMQDLDMRAKGLAVQREGLTLQREQGKDRLQQLDEYRLASIQQAARKIEAIKTQTSVPAVRAAADEVLAGLSAKHAEVLGTAQERFQQQKNAEAARAQAAQFHKDQMALGWAQLDQQRQQLAVTTAEKLIDRKDAAGAARVKLLGEQGIIDPNTKDFLLTPQGQAKMAAADGIEAQARKDPTQPALAYVAQLRKQQGDSPEAKAQLDDLENRVKSDPRVAAQTAQAYANNIRDDARANDASVANNKKSGEEAQKAVADAHEMLLKTDTARRALQSDPSPANREAWASLRTQFQFVKAQAAKGLGERLSVRAMEALDEVLSIDADSIWSRSVDKGKAIAALNALDQEVKQHASSALSNAGIKTNWQPATSANSPTWEGQTAQEAADSAKLRGGTGMADIALGGLMTEREKQQAYEAALARTGTRADGSPGSPSNYGLEPNQEAMLDGLIKRAGSAGSKEYGRIVEDLTDPLLQISGDKSRPSLAKGVAEKLRDEDPALLDAVLANIANRPGGGQMKADEIRAKLSKPTGAIPVPRGGLTPAAADELATMKDRASRGLPPVPVLSPAPMRDAGPPLPAFLQGLSAADRAKAIEWMRANGVGAQ